MLQKLTRIALAGVLLPAFLSLSNGPDAHAQSNHICAEYPTNYSQSSGITGGGTCTIGGGSQAEVPGGRNVRCATGVKPTRPQGLTATAFHDTGESGIRLAWTPPGTSTEADRNVYAYEIYRRNEATETKMTMYRMVKLRINSGLTDLPAQEYWQVLPDSCFGPTATNPTLGADLPNGTCELATIGSVYRKRTPVMMHQTRGGHVGGPACTFSAFPFRGDFIDQIVSWRDHTTFVDPFVTPGQSYAYRLVARTAHLDYDGTGLHDHPGRNYAGKDRSDWSVSASATLTQRNPGTPTSVAGALDSSGFVKVTWTAPVTTTTNSAPGAYQLRRSSDSGSTWTVLPALEAGSGAVCSVGGVDVPCSSATATLPTSHIDKDEAVTANTAYIYQVRAKRFHCGTWGQIQTGCSEWNGSWSSSTASVTTGGTLNRASALKPVLDIVDDSNNRPQPIPVPPQELPAGSATLSASATQLGLQEVVTLTAATANAPEGMAPLYHFQYHDHGTWLDTFAGSSSSPSFTYLEAAPVIMVFRVRVTYGTEYVADSAPVAVTWGNPDRTVTIDGDTVTFNSPATGAPTISGTAQVGETLTASTAGIADPDGLTGAAFAYQWISSRDGTDTDISGATASTYTLAAADAGAAIKVRVSFNDDNGNAVTLTSAATAAVAAADAETPPSVGKSVQRDTQPTVPPSTVPGQVPGLQASLTSSGHVSLSWTAPGVEDDGSNAPAIYRIVRRAAGGEFGLLTSVPGVSLTHTDSTVTAGTDYVYRVQGVNGAGNGTLSAPASIAVPQRLTAAFHGMPSGHNGTNLFTFEVRFSEDVSGLRAGPVQRALSVTNARIIDVTRAVAGKNRRWTVKVRPTSFDDITIALAATTDCSATGAVCDSNGRKFSSAVSATVGGPVAVSVADARANEADGTISFAVTLNRAAVTAVTVNHATRDGTAVAGADYTFTRGTLTFAAGDLEKTVSVPILDDAIDEGEETFKLKLTGASGVAIGDGEATGTIVNSDPLQAMWLSRFGRMVASDAVEAVTARLETPRAEGSHLTLAGQRLDLSRVDDEQALAEALAGLARTFGAHKAQGPGGDLFGRQGPGDAWNDRAATAGRSMTVRELLAGTSFRAVLGGGSGSRLTSWGQGASVSRFSAAAPGLSLSGDAATGALGIDYERGRLLTGFAMTHSVGDGAADDGAWRYAMGSTVTTMLPYARFALTERVSAWGLAGTGSGRLTLDLDGGVSQHYGTDLSMRLAAGGLRGELLSPDEAGGFALALKADAFWVRTASKGLTTSAGNLMGARGESSRLRAVLDGSRTFALSGGATLAPSVELGLRHDGGDAETGTGVEVVGRVAYAKAGSGLRIEASVRTLVAHDDSDYEEWGASGAVRLAPGASGRGLSFSLAPTWGTPSSGVDQLWSARDARGLAAGGGKFEAEQRLEGEIGYGLAMFGDRFTGTPNLGFGFSDTARDYRIGWRLTSALKGVLGFEVNLDATRTESVDGNAPVDHGAMLRGTARW